MGAGHDDLLLLRGALRIDAPEPEKPEVRIAAADVSFEEIAHSRMHRAVLGREAIVVDAEQLLEMVLDDFLYFGDFELEFEVKLDHRLNSGVQVRSQSLDSFRDGIVFGYQVEIAENGNAGFIYDAERRGWLSLDRSEPKARGAYEPGAWNSYRVVCKGATISTWVNDIPVESLQDRMDPTGFIALQVHSFGMPKGIPGRAPLSGGKNPGHVRWRNIRVRILDE